MAGELVKRGRGQPTVITPQVLAALDQAFEWGCTDKEACLHAGIGERTLYEYCQRNPDYAQRKEALKDTPTINARRTIAEQVRAKHGPTAQWLLERKRRDEYGNQPGIGINITVPTIHYGRLEELNSAGGNTENLPPVPVASIAGQDAGGSGDSGRTER